MNYVKPVKPSETVTMIKSCIHKIYLLALHFVASMSFIFKRALLLMRFKMYIYTCRLNEKYENWYVFFDLLSGTKKA